LSASQVEAGLASFSTQREKYMAVLPRLYNSNTTMVH